MLRLTSIILAIITVTRVNASDVSFKFSAMDEHSVPSGFESIALGDAVPGKWSIVKDQIESEFGSLFGEKRAGTHLSVLAQSDRSPVDEHFPVFIYQDAELTDFTIETRFKILAGGTDQMAGIAFRIQDANNYYIIRASAHDNTFRFYKVVGGLRGQLIGPQISIEKHQWYDLKIQCSGNRIQCWLDNKEAFPALTDPSFISGKIGFWTKSDTVAYFGDTSLSYRARTNLGQSIVAATAKEFPFLVGIQMISQIPDTSQYEIIASHDDHDIGAPATKTQIQVFDDAVRVYEKKDGNVILTVPIADRNGDPIAAVRLTMESFPGQTKNNAMARTVPIVRYMQSRVGAARTMLEN